MYVYNSFNPIYTKLLKNSNERPFYTMPMIEFYKDQTGL